MCLLPCLHKAGKAAVDLCFLFSFSVWFILPEFCIIFKGGGMVADLPDGVPILLGKIECFLQSRQ